jgi:hypothetical protein
MLRLLLLEVNTIDKWHILDLGLPLARFLLDRWIGELAESEQPRSMKKVCLPFIWFLGVYVQVCGGLGWRCEAALVPTLYSTTMTAQRQARRITYL